MALKGGGWSPLGHRDFRRLWSAQFTSNVGSWMQTVAAQWVMISLTRSALLLTAISAAGSLPVMLLAVPGGALGDLVDRRRLIIATQMLMLAGAAGLVILSVGPLLTPAVLLALLVVIGVGGALSAPTWQTLQPELVPAADRQQAVALGSVNQNLARAVGPAVGGLLLAATSAAVVFGVNAVSFLAVVAAVMATRIPKRTQDLPREHVVAAIRAGGRFVANSPGLLALILRATVFIFPAGAIWALLPLVARDRLGLGSAGYGLLLGCVGIGAVLAATFGPALRRMLTPQLEYAAACLALGASAVLLGVTHVVAVAVIALVAAGAAWITGLGLLGAAYQAQLPVWVKARAMSYYLVAFQGANAIGALAFGGVAQASSVTDALWILGVCLAVGTLVTWRLTLSGAVAAKVANERFLPLAPPANLEAGDRPVAVTVDYLLASGNEQAFMQLAWSLRQMRRRTGAVHWHLHRDAEEAVRFQELFVVGSWTEHERQHERLTSSEQTVLAQIDALLAPGFSRLARHAFSVRVTRR